MRLDICLSCATQRNAAQQAYNRKLKSMTSISNRFAVAAALSEVKLGTLRVELPAGSRELRERK